MNGNEVSLMSELIEFLRNADAVAFLSVFIIALYKGKIRWGADCDADKQDLQEDKRSLQAIVDHYHSGLEAKVQRYEDERAKRVSPTE